MDNTPDGLDPQHRQLLVEGYDLNREILPVGKDDKGNIKELAIGFSTSKLFVRGPTGRLYAVVAPGELVEELYPTKVPDNAIAEAVRLAALDPDFKRVPNS